ncbi:penicillin-binding protein [Streptomyces sp. NBC_00053]|uniref:transglycosylase domain-containing protein n=1 Tax=unclassified Streptomyces TaxID=2593676 RepID=UPI000F5BC4BE|nr:MULTISPECIES: transglycosylase domain-containing protein [unclassified Streptomyces]WSG51658.1 penicillin-binding protein [Streptomyces sp. NBC_01732]WSX02315.1 penicillin-binding protein [Streptomyces sp. NBC_00987]MCX5501392.1 penicillin-binding protein [Streptomyces sp. NBC_00052]MCX5550073.1 penicillin-binding protein [Streptomyces sp. NBC_00051]RPK69150.1 Penicillin-binding protein 1F [Streptomyces sp. ADI95-17]
MPKKRSGGGLSTTQQAAKFLGVAALSGVVLAGIALPAAGALGLATKGTVEGFDEIPANLKTPPLSQRTTILDSKGGMIATVYSRDRTVVPLKNISPYMQKAIVAIEDARFYEHGAVDLKGILRALNRNVQTGGTAEGASTLTQQYVKNVFVEEAGDDPDKVAQATQQTMGRKVQELKYAIQVEEELGKKKILENYLNITFFGQQAYGVEAASQRYFSKSAKDLTLEESALLAGVVQSPSRYDPVNDTAEATKRRNMVLQRMADVGDISRAQADKAKATPIKLRVKKPKNGCITAVSGAGFFCDYVRHVFLTDAVFGKTKEDRAKIWNRGGLTIRTTLDPQSQQSVQGSIKNHVYKSDKVATAVTLVQPGTGKIMGMGQSKPYGFGTNETQYNYSVDKAMGGSNYGFPTGSTFKPFVAAAAIAQGKPATQVYSSPYEMPYPTVQTCDKPYVNLNGERVPNENESERGPYALKEAMEKSVNTYFIQMVEDIGLCPVAKMTDKLGVVQGNGEKLPQSPAIALGSKGLSPLTMASAYAAFANRGTYCTPVAMESVSKADGTALPVPKTTCSQAMSPTTADTINTLLRGVVDSGTGQEAGLQSRDNAGKTGTTDARKNAWFVGYTPNMSGAVWVGSPSQSVEMEHITIGGVYQDKVYGGQVPGPIWRDAMTGALNGVTAPSFNTVDIPDPPKNDEQDSDRDRDKGHGRDKGRPGAGGKKPGDKSPFPGISISPDLIGGNNGGGHRGQTTGGTQGP